jgi:ATP-dependent helicase/nuclease subunit A
MKNELIEASAGTGKTQSLAQHLIALLKEGVPPQEIVALTFSRAAAGEIFERFVTLLAESAETSHESAEMLRRVLATQHLSQIGTLDSFLMRIVRSFPLELGLVGDLRILDDYEADCKRASVSFSILRRTDAATKKRFVEAFSFAMNRANVRSFVESYRAFIKEWHKNVTSLDEKSAWGDPAAIWGCDPAFAHVTERELAAAADAIRGFVGGKDADRWQAFEDWVRGFRGSVGKPTGFTPKILERAESLFGEEIFKFVFGSKKKEYAFTREQTLALRDAIVCVAGYSLRKSLELARGVYAVVSAFEKEYDERVRRSGNLVFDDVPRLLSRLPEETRLSLEFRLDSRLRAWALDEFQDTSRDQWQVLENLIDEARQSGGEQSVFIVGDRKQAIYGWRNGDVTIFEREHDSGFYELGELRKTYRSGPDVIAAVNRVFAGGRISEEFPAWKCPEHETARPELTGFVRVMDAPGNGKEDYVEPVFEAIKANIGLDEGDPRRRDVSTAILVRQNAFGELLANELRARGVEGIVWEGETNVLDTSALSGFLDLVQLADHPGDAVTFRHFCLTALAAAKYPNGVPGAAEVSREMAQSFMARGLVRTLRELRALLPADPAAAWSDFTEERFTDLLRAAATFENGRSSDTRLADFPRFLAAQKKRTVAAKGKIRILSIHRSKGLGFDYVILPLYEHDALNKKLDGPLVGDGWILPDPGPLAPRVVKGLKEAFDLRKNRAEQEALCMYYVAMTRAKRAMTIVLRPPAKSESESVRFSDLVRSAELGDLAHEEFRFGIAGGMAADAAGGMADGTAIGQTNNSTPVHCSLFTVHCPRAPRVRIARRLPSLSFATGVSAGSLFASAERRAAALRRGTAAHATAAQVEFTAALPKPEGFVALWREKAFEVFADGEWTSGRFDRVTFFRDAAGELCAEVVDFKTSLKNPERYDGQLAAYRRAVTALTGIPPERVTSRLVEISAEVA